MSVLRSRRPAFTLIELLTVIAIIAVLAALTAIFFPNFQDTELVNRGADQLQNWLLSAKMQAKRDGLPTGIRLFPIQNSGTPPFTVSTVAYIQQPNPFAQGIYTGADTDPNPSAVPNTFGFPRAKFFIPPASPAPQITFFDGTAGAVVSPGDYLELFGGGVMRRIVRIPSTFTNDSPTFFPPTPMASPPENASLILEQTSAPIPPLTPPTSSATNYRIILSPREMAGEQQLSLPTNVVVSFETPDNTNPNITPLSRNVPNVPTNQGFVDILFSPSGAVVGQGTGTGQIILWVRDGSKSFAPPASLDLLVGKGTLITIQPRTGFIAAHPVAPGADPYLFTRDGKSSGL
jgi:prepilin-type N-terminal cleavage/methylation domain-containing protein